MKTKPTCAVCVETFNKSTRKPIECGHCQFSSCASCVKRYLLDSTTPQCMDCGSVWDREYMDSILPKNFIGGEYKKHRENVLFDRERALIPETMPVAENEKRARLLYAEVVALNTAFMIAQGEQEEADAQVQEPTTIEDALANLRVKHEVSKKHLEQQQRIQYLSTHIMLLRDVRHADSKRQFVRGCPAADCRGLLSSQWKCGLCNVWVCPDCHEVLGADKPAIDEHTCDPDLVKSAKLMAKDTKPCPKCASLIFKSEGCDQMWCTQCQTAFSWRTGKIETGRLHNPHYFDYMRRRNGGEAPREIGDVPCGGMPHYQAIHDVLSRLFKTGYARVDLICRLHAEIEMIHVPALQTNAVQDNRQLRIKYILQDISETEFKRQLQIRETQSNKKTELLQVFQMFLLTSADVMRMFVENAKTKAEAELYIEEIMELRAYTNACFEKIGRRYKCVPKVIQENWILT
jgi:hypothetical protein